LSSENGESGGEGPRSRREGGGQRFWGVIGTGPGGGEGVYEHSGTGVSAKKRQSAVRGSCVGEGLLTKTAGNTKGLQGTVTCGDKWSRLTGCGAQSPVPKYRYQRMQEKRQGCLVCGGCCVLISVFTAGALGGGPAGLGHKRSKTKVDVRKTSHQRERP